MRIENYVVPLTWNVFIWLNYLVVGEVVIHSDGVGKVSKNFRDRQLKVPSVRAYEEISAERKWYDTDQELQSSTCRGEIYQGCPEKNHMRPVACYPRDASWLLRRQVCPEHCASGIHLAPGKHLTNSMTISFSLDFTCDKPEHPDSAYILVGTDPNNLERAENIKSTIKQYNSTSCMAEDPQECITETKHWCTTKHFDLYVSDWSVHLTLADLEPGTKYYYTTYPRPCASSSQVFTSNGLTNEAGDRIFSFKTASDHSSPETSMKLAILGDTERTPNTDITMSHVYKSSSEFTAMILAGDLAYAYRDHRSWDRWLGQYEELFATTPFLISPGNHDQDTDCCDWTNFKAYENRFQMPQVKSAISTPACQELASGPDYNSGTYDYGNAFYSVVIGPVHIIVLNTYTALDRHGEQYYWFEREIKRVNRTKSPWLFIVAHANIYETFKKHKNEDPQVRMKKRMESLFVKYKVNLFLSGHDHAYARTHSVAYGKRSVKAPMYITIGNSGAESQEDTLQHNERWLASWDFWSFGYGTISVFNRTDALWETFFHNNTNTTIIQNTDRIYLKNYLFAGKEDNHAEDDVVSV